MTWWQWLAVAILGLFVWLLIGTLLGRLIGRAIHYAGCDHPDPGDDWHPPLEDITDFIYRAEADPGFWERLEREVRGQP